MKHIARSAGRSATAAAAYRSGSRIEDDRTGTVHDYRAKRGVLSSFILSPSRAPDWAQDTQQLWNRVEQAEKRVDSRVARENIVALPHELNLEQNSKWLQEFVNDNYVKRGMVAQVSIHAPDHEGDNRNYHAHIMLSPRPITRNGFKETKPRTWNDVATLNKWREAFAEYQNRALERHGHEIRVDHRSYRDRGIDREPTQHVGPAANQIARDENETDIAQRNSLTKKFNQHLEDMKSLKQHLEEQMELERQRQAKHQQLNKQIDALQKDDIEGKRIPNDPYGDLEKLDKQRKLEARHQRERSALENELQAFYQCKEKESQIKETKQHLQAADNWWSSLTGRKAQLQEELRVAKLNLENARIREQERVQTLEKTQASERLELLGPETDVTPRTDFNRAAHGNAPAPRSESVPVPLSKQIAPTQLRAERVKPVKEGELKPLPGYQGVYKTKAPERDTPKEKAPSTPEERLPQMPKLEAPQRTTASNDNEPLKRISDEFNRNASDHTETAKSDFRDSIREKMRSRLERNRGDDRSR